MGVFSARMVKYKINAVKPLEVEKDRASQKLKNKDIDYSRSDGNYSLIDEKPNTMTRLVNQRIEELKASKSRIQANSVVLAGQVYTLPKDVDPSREREYFQVCLDTMKNYFGAENILSAMVHKDETSPHMHLYFVPVNPKTGKLQARSTLNADYLNHVLHGQTVKNLQAQGFNVVRGDSENKEYINDIHAYKEVMNEIDDKKKL